jgi:putative two-component system response regulator
VSGEHPWLLGGGRVLVVDDQVTNLELAAALLEDDGFHVDTAPGGVAALAQVAQHAPDCIVLDAMMPNMDGFATCRLLKADYKTRHVPVLMLTALADADDKLEALRCGADDFLRKPVDGVELLARVRSLVRIKRLHDDLSTAEEIIVAMSRALENKHPRAQGHGGRVALGAVRLAQALDLPPAQVHALGRAGVLHDLGKIGVPELLLTEETERHRWALEEERLFRRHPEIGERILAPLASFAEVRRLVRHHHERLDGSGWPDGIGGDDFDRAVECLALVNHVEDTAARTSPAAAAADLRAAVELGRFRRDTAERWLELAAQPVSGSWRAQLPLVPQARPGKVLVANDDPGTRELHAAMLERAGHVVVTVEDGAAAVAATRHERPDLVVSDVRMPRLSGPEVCRALKADPATELVPVVLVTASAGLADRHEGLEAGADDFLIAPIGAKELTTRVASLLRLHQYYVDLEDHQNVLVALAGALEAKDPWATGHSDRVALLAADLARALGQDEPFCERMRVAGTLHDIGTIGVPERILRKPGALTDAERREVMTHAPRGDSICRPLRTLADVLPIIRHHHERLDGSGYPDGLAGEAIPIGARVLGLADAWDALTSDRPHRRRLGEREALAVLAEETRAGKWEAKVVVALERVLAARR